MNITTDTKVLELIDKYPFLLDFLTSYNEKFSLLKNPVMRNTMGRVATLSMAAQIAGIEVNKLIEDIKAEIGKRSETGSERVISDSDKQEKLKSIIKDLHSGVPIEEVKKRFNEMIKDLDASEIAAMEERLILEGMPVEEIQKLCDLHVNVFKDLLNRKPGIEVPEGHPIGLYLRENKEILIRINKIQEILTRLNNEKRNDLFDELKNALIDLQNINYHYLRKENQLFPYLEKHGFTGPSQVMWGIHDEIRKKLKDAIRLSDERSRDELSKLLTSLLIAINEMIYKEENILFPTALKLLSEKEWEEIKSGEKEIGFSFITPDYSSNENKAEGKFSGGISLSTGWLTREQLDAILKTLPIDISFVDENDEVRYYSDTKDRIFPRSPGVIGRKVQRCHPPKSIHIVEKILSAFKSGERDVAEFFIRLNGREIHIRYFAVRDDNGKYLGTLEVSQDVTDIKRLNEEKRILNWE
jgi:PAS domain S-box-containing protein